MKNKNTTILMLILLAFVILLHVSSFLTVAYLTWPISSLTLEKASALGGSYGVIGTLFSGLAFWGLIWTILIQRSEIRHQRIASKRDRVSELLLSEARACSNDLNSVKFTFKKSILAPNGKIHDQWEFFYKIERFMVAKCDNEITPEQLIAELHAVVKENVKNLTYFYERLNQACDVARYMLADDEIPVKELGEIKLLFFSQFNNNIFVMSDIIKKYIEALQNKCEPKSGSCLFHPLTSIMIKIGSINQFEKQEVDEEFVRSWQSTFDKHHND